MNCCVLVVRGAEEGESREVCVRHWPLPQSAAPQSLEGVEGHYTTHALAFCSSTDTESMHVHTHVSVYVHVHVYIIMYLYMCIGLPLLCTEEE